MKSSEFPTWVNAPCSEDVILSGNKPTETIFVPSAGLWSGINLESIVEWLTNSRFEPRAVMSNCWPRWALFKEE